MPTAPRHAAVLDAPSQHAAHAPLASSAAFADRDTAYAPAVAGPYPFGPPTAEVDVSSFLSRSPLATVGGWMAEGMAQLDASGFRLRGVATLGFAAAFAVGLAFTIGFGVGRTTGDAPVAMEAAMVAPSAPAVETEQRTVNVTSGASDAMDTAALDTAAAEAAERAAIAEAAAEAEAAEARAAEQATAEEAEAALRSRRTRRARLRRARARRRSR